MSRILVGIVEQEFDTSIKSLINRINVMHDHWVLISKLLNKTTSFFNREMTLFLFTEYKYSDRIVYKNPNFISEGEKICPPKMPKTHNSSFHPKKVQNAN